MSGETRYLVVSSDSHAGPSLERSLRPYCPPAHLVAFDEFVADLRSGAIARGDRDDELSDADKLINFSMKTEALPEAFAEALAEVKGCAGHDDPQARLRDMDADGIAAEVIFAGGQNDEVMPFIGFGADQGPAAVDPALRLVGDQIWNRWLADFVAAAPERLLGVAQVPIWDVAAAVREVEWSRAHGLRAVNLPAPRSDLVPYNDPAYDPFWGAVEATGMTLVTHTGGGEMPFGLHGLGGRYIYAFERFWMSRRHLQQMIFGGVFDRFPRLRVVFTEQMVAWVPRTLDDLDNVCRMGRARHDRGTPHWVPPQRLPSEYWASNCFNAGSFLARHEAEMRHELGCDTLLWGSDYPHHEGTWPHTALSLRKTFSGLPEREVRRILGENALRAFDLDASVLRPIADRIGPVPSDVDRPLTVEEYPRHPGFAFREFENF